MEPHDVLTDDVDIRRPVMPARVGIIGETAPCQVIIEGVHPYVHYVLRIARHGQTPRECGAADGKILQPGLDKPDDLIAAGLGPDEGRVRLVMSEQAVLVPREPKKVALFLDPFDGRARGSAP